MFNTFEVVLVENLTESGFQKAIILDIVRNGSAFKVRSLDTRDKLSLVSIDRVKRLT